MHRWRPMVLEPMLRGRARAGQREVIERRGGPAMMRLRRASLIAALSLLAWAATASAECAWVAWVHETRTKVTENKRSDHWDTAGASDNEAGCDSKLKGQIARIQGALEDGPANSSKDEQVY